MKPVQATNYYFSSSIGDDSRTATTAQNPSTPWRSISKLNAIFSSLRPGDAVYFQRGDVFYGSIHINASGTSSNPIRIGAYGTGSAPVITGLSEVTGWRNLGNGIFESTNTFGASGVSVVLMDGEIQEMGRFPNRAVEDGGYLTITGINGNNSLSSTQLPSSPNFTGGEAVIRKVQWIIDRHPITSHSGNSINYSGSTGYLASINYGFFIQDHINTLDLEGEWFYNRTSRRLNFFFGSTNPTSRRVSLVTLDHLLTKSFGSSNVVVEGLHFRGSNKDAVHLSGGSGIKVRNNLIEFAGENGIYVTSVLELEIDNCVVSTSLNSGIYLRFGNPGARVTNNRVENSSFFQGGAQSSSNNGVGIFAGSDNILVENNIVTNTGYNGIHFNGNGTIVRNNLVDGYCIHKNDGGGIYSFGGQDGTVFRGRQVDGNIIVNGLGSNVGTPREFDLNFKPHASGIFLDDNVTGVRVVNNTIAHTDYTGIKLANVRDIQVHNNTFYDTDSHILLGNSNNGGDTRNVTITNNTFFSKNGDQAAVTIRTNKDDIAQMADFDNNRYTSPLGHQRNFSLTYQSGSTRQTEILDLGRWQTRFNKDINSRFFSPGLKPFDIVGFSGPSLYTSGSFESNSNGINCSQCQISRVLGVLTGYALQISSPGYSVARVSVRSIKANTDYILSFRGVSNIPGSLRVFLRFSGSPWEQFSNTSVVNLGTRANEFNVHLTSSINVEDAVIMLVSDDGNWTYWLDDLSFREAEVNVTKPEEVFLFEYNASKTKKTVPLNGSYVDAWNRTYSNRIELDPFTSMVLIRTDGKNETSPVAPPSIQLTAPSNNQQFDFGTAVNLTANASSQSSSIVRVNYFSGEQQIGSTTSAPYSFRWNAPLGTHQLRAQAVDANGQSTFSEPITVVVRQPTTSIGNGTTDGINGVSINFGTTSPGEFQGITYIPVAGTSIQTSNYNNIVRTASSNISIYQSAAFAPSMKFDIPVENGSYTVITYHHEVYFGVSGPAATEGQRVFDIAIEGNVVKKDLDLFREFKNTETALTFENIVVADGVLTVELTASANNAIIAAIQVIPNRVEESRGGFSLFINAGGRTNEHHDGNVFISDFATPFFSSSNTNENTLSSSIPLFQTHRFAADLRYTIPVPNGTYVVTTYHKENHFGSNGITARQGQRVFDIWLEGVVVKKDIDMFLETSNREMKLVFDDIVVRDGVLDLRLLASTNNAIISGIGLVSKDGASLEEDSRPSFFINTGSSDPVTYGGYSFSSDFNPSYFSGASNISSFSGASSERLFQSHRFAPDLRYKIPVANGSYTVVTFHNETYFGKRISLTGPRRRVFDIYVEGDLKQRDLDLFVESENRPIVLTFENILVGDELLEIDLIASINNATISGIAVIPQGANVSMGTSNLRQVREFFTVDANMGGTFLSGFEEGSDSKVFPNPASHVAYLKLVEDLLDFTVQISNTSGQIVQTYPARGMSYNDGNYEIPVGHLPKGIYILTVMTEREMVLRHKLIVNP